MSDSLKEADSPLALDNQICFRLYAVSRAIQRRYRGALDALGITYPQYLVLLALWQWQAEQPDYEPTQQAIAERLHLDSGTVTPLIARMVKSGLLTKKSSREDGRAWLISLTRKGLQLKARAVTVPETMLRFAPVEFDLRGLKNSLDTLLKTLESND